MREATAEERGPLLGEAQLRELADCVDEDRLLLWIIGTLIE